MAQKASTTSIQTRSCVFQYTTSSTSLQKKLGVA